MSTLLPSTELDAVNALLESIGESPVNTLTGEVFEDVITARNKLAQTSRSVQTKGWGFNTEYDFPLQREASTNEIKLPSNTVKVEINTAGVDCVQRGMRLYDRKAKSFQFDQSVTAETLVLLLPFDELPEAARWYITVKAQRIFGDGITGDRVLNGFTQQDETDAHIAFVEAEGDTEDFSIFMEPSMKRAQLRKRKR